MKIDKKLFFVSNLTIIIFLIMIVKNLSKIQNTISLIYDFCIGTFGWFFVITNLCCLIFSVYIMFGPYKNVKLGGENCLPEFRTLSWAGMMFTTSCGAWLIVYGFLEPIYCAAQAPFQIQPLSIQAYEYGQMYAHFHWGPNAWCIYVPITIAIGYFLYNRNSQRGSVGTVCNEINKKKGGGILVFIIDVIAVISTVIAPVISIGTGMPLLTALIERIFRISDQYKTVLQVIILFIWMLIFGTSVFLGLKKGIKTLSNANIIMAFAFMAIFLILLGLTKVCSAEINTSGLFITNFVRMNSYTDPFGTGSFVKGWTWSYWACYFVYMPLMGVFNAKISRGRKLRDIVFGQLILCSLGCWVAMATLGNYAIELQMNSKVDIVSFLEVGDEAGAILAILDASPIPMVLLILLLVVSFVFLASTMDSSAFAAAEMTTIEIDGKKMAPRWLRIFWSLIASLIAFVMLQVGGVKAVRSLCYIAGLPLAIIVYLVIYSVITMLKQDLKK